MTAPPAVALVRILLRGADARQRAESMKKDALAGAAKRDLKLNISASPTLFGGGREWGGRLVPERPDLLPGRHGWERADFAWVRRLGCRAVDARADRQHHHGGVVDGGVFHDES